MSLSPRTCRAPGGRGDPVVGTGGRGLPGLRLPHGLEVEDEHDDGAILVLHRHHVHQAREGAACGRGVRTWGDGTPTREGTPAWPQTSWETLPLSLLGTPSRGAPPPAPPFLLTRPSCPPLRGSPPSTPNTNSTRHSPTAAAPQGETEAQKGGGIPFPPQMSRAGLCVGSRAGGAAGGSGGAGPG